MKKTIIIIISSFFLCSFSYAETYYFKNCKISTAVIGDYTINLEKNVINVELTASSGEKQNFNDKIKLIEKNKIISEKIKSLKGVDLYYQYFLNSEEKSITKLEYKKESGIDIDVFNLFSKRESFCSDVKSDWNKQKIDEAKTNKEKGEILKAQKKIKKEQIASLQCKGNDYKKWNKCKGSYKTSAGYKYDGIFKNGLIIKGISIYPGGEKYVGDFRNQEPHGYGTFRWANDDQYLGEWLDGKIHGNGTKIWKDGRKYVGNFKNDKLHGEGTLLYPDGKKYVGEFINGKRHGKGTFTYSDGTAFIGKFVNGEQQGMGQCVSVDGSTLPCKSKTEVQKKDFTNKDTREILIVAKKWVRISQYENNSKKGKKIMDKLKSDFELKASELCSSKGNYKVLRKNIEVLDLDETPAYGLETKLKLGVTGLVECI